MEIQRAGWCRQSPAVSSPLERGEINFCISNRPLKGTVLLSLFKCLHQHRPLTICTLRVMYDLYYSADLCCLYCACVNSGFASLEFAQTVAQTPCIYSSLLFLVSRL